MKVFVLDKRGTPLMPCHPARARQMLAQGRAVVHRRAPFTLRLKDRVGGAVQPVRLKVDPGSRVTGFALLREQKERDQAEVLHLAELHHKPGIRQKMEKRRAYRRRRRSARLRYRAPRFQNRRREEGWLPPSLQSRVEQVATWVRRYGQLVPLAAISLEWVRFDTHKLVNPEVSGVAYQQGTLHGYEVREYLLEKWGRRCAYCGAEEVPLQVEHIVPKVRGGSDRVSNLTLACGPCNQAKGSLTAEEYGHPAVQAQARQTLRDAAAVNATRWAIYGLLADTGLPLEAGTGGRTKYNRGRLGLPKNHALDALCVGASTPARILGLDEAAVLVLRARGRGQYRRTNVDQHGFPRGYLPREKGVLDFRTGDLVWTEVPGGKYVGTHEGVVLVRRSGYFDVRRDGARVAQGIHARHCRVLQRDDGYGYERRAPFLPSAS